MPNEIKITLRGDALVLFEDFLKYSELDPEAVADAMYYDHGGFKARFRDLRRAYAKATETK